MRFPTFTFVWYWDLRATPEQLWPLVSDTNRFNRDTRLPAVEAAAAGNNGRQRVRLRHLGVRVEWDEEPFEWLRPRRFSVVRRHRSGPVGMLQTTVDLLPVPGDGGTQIVYRSVVRPRTLLGLIGLAPWMALVVHRRFEAAFRRYDDEATAARSTPIAQPVHLSRGARERLLAFEALLSREARPELVARLVGVVAQADELSVARLQPYALADAWAEPRREVLDLVLHATRAGLLDMRWEVLCPLCRGAKEMAGTLHDLATEVHCATCGITFTADFERSVELTFRPSPGIRDVAVGEYCVGSPQRTPHIVMQQLLAPAEVRELWLPLEAGRYRVRTLGTPGGRWLLVREEGAAQAALTVQPGEWPEGDSEASTHPLLRIQNDTAEERLFILERAEWADQAVTAAEVFRLQTFRDLFAAEVLRPGEQVSVGSLTVLFTDLVNSTQLYRQIGDAPAFGRVLDHFHVLEEAIEAEEGAVVKTIGDAVMAVFPAPLPALRAILAAQTRLAVSGDGLLRLKAGMHHGPCLAVTLNARLDYFGSVVNLAARLQRLSDGDEVILSDVARRDPEVAALIAATDAPVVEPFEASLKGFEGESFNLWRVRRPVVATAPAVPPVAETAVPAR